jgi:hypothetical protein
MKMDDKKTAKLYGDANSNKNSDLIKNESNTNDGANENITFYPIVMNEDVFSLKIKALYGEIEQGMVMDVGMFDAISKKKLLSTAFICKDRNEIIGVLNSNIPSRKTGYMIYAKVLANDKSVLLKGSKDYTIEDETSLMNIKVHDPVSRLDEIIVANDKSTDNDYEYSKNSTYTAQDQLQTLDVFLPFSVMLSPADKYKINKILDYKLTMTDGNKNTFRHCGNRKYNSVVIDESKQNATIRIADEWKNRIKCKDYEDNKATFHLSLWVAAELEYTGDDGDIQGVRKISWSTETIPSDTFLLVTFEW